VAKGGGCVRFGLVFWRDYTLHLLTASPFILGHQHLSQDAGERQHRRTLHRGRVAGLYVNIASSAHIWLLQDSAEQPIQVLVLHIHIIYSIVVHNTARACLGKGAGPMPLQLIVLLSAMGASPSRSQEYIMLQYTYIHSRRY
jgi:hypothetical protein